MSHQTGIHASDELKALFAKCKSARDIRLLKLTIDKEKLVCDDTRPMSISTNNLDWKKDWSNYMVQSFLPRQKPCYILFRLGATNDNQEITVTSSPPQPQATSIATTASSTTSSGKQPTALSTPTATKQGIAASIVSKLTSSLTSSSSSNSNNTTSNNNGNQNQTCGINSGESNSKNLSTTSASTASTCNSIDANLPHEAAKDQWLFVSWTPELSPVREKMIYASTKSSLKQEFGGGSIFADYFVASSDDLSVDAVTKWIDRKRQIRDGHIDMNELSLGEQELQQVKAHEAALCADLAAAALKDRAAKSIPNIEMPIDDKAISAFYDFKEGKISYVQLCIDPKTETILLEKSVATKNFNLAKQSIGSLTPKDHARYHLVAFSHEHNKKQTKSNIFVYSITSSGCPVKERMLYSSVKNSLLQVISEESKIGITVDRRIETDDPSELTEKFLLEELYPPEPSPSTPQAFIKPKGPSKSTTGSASRRRVM